MGTPGLDYKKEDFIMNRYDMLERETEKKIKRDIQNEDNRHQEQRYQDELRRQYSREIMLIEETLKPLISTLEAEKKKSDKDITEIKAGLLHIIQKIKAIQEELESQRKEATSALSQASKITHTTAHMIENHMDKAKLLSNIKDWAYPLMTAVLVSLLWTASLKLWLPNYNAIVTNQSQIWHKLEEISKAHNMSNNELKADKEK